MNTLPEFNPNSSPEERYQELLESSLLPHEAHYVVYLEYHYKNYEEHRMLELLYHSTTRKSAELILNLEMKVKKTAFEINLQIVLMDPDVCDMIKLFLAAHYRQHQMDYICWFDYEADDGNNTSLWYPKEWCEKETCIEYLSSKTDLTSQETQFLTLLTDADLQQYLTDILVLKHLKQRNPYEQIYLEMLLDPDTHIYAKKIVDLIHLKNKSLSQKRLLELLLDADTRKYAQTIVFYEFKINKTPEEKKYLALLLDPITRSNAKFIITKETWSYENLLPDEKEVLIEYYLYKITPLQPFSEKIKSFYAPLSLLDKRNHIPPNAILNAQGVLYSDHVIKKEIMQCVIHFHSEQILTYYLDLLHVNETLTLKHIDPTHSEEMTAYMERTIHFLEFNLTQYLYMSNQTFDEEKLNHLNVKIREKMIHPPHENLHAMVKKSIIELLQDTQLTNELSSL